MKVLTNGLKSKLNASAPPIREINSKDKPIKTPKKVPNIPIVIDKLAMCPLPNFLFKINGDNKTTIANILDMDSIL